MIFKSRTFTSGGVAGLLLVLVLQLALSSMQISQTWDEAPHIYAGYSYWNTGDYGINPEHPPLVKVLASAPLLRLPVHLPKIQQRYFKVEEFLDGRDFVYENDPEVILSRSRAAAASLTVLLGLFLFFAGREMFGAGAGLLGLALFVFDPNFLAHGALVTTDVGVTCFLFATVFGFYRYQKKPGVIPLLLTAGAAGCTLAAKHSGILVVPMLAALAIVEIVRSSHSEKKLLKPLARAAAELVIICAVAVAILWATYGFHYSARPTGLAMNPPLIAQLDRLPTATDLVLISGAARWHLLPEAYLYGLSHILSSSVEIHSYLFGNVYAHPVWFYFPCVFAIKSTLPLLLLLAVFVPFALAGLWRKTPREVTYLIVPVFIYSAQAIGSGVNLGLRHILPIYSFLIVLAAGAASWLITRNRRWIYPLAILLAAHVASSIHAYPNYIAYSNEAWGGPSQTYKYLTDSNVDWGQQLRQVRGYLQARHITNCWFAYFAEAVVDRDHYGVPCVGLPTISSRLEHEADLPAEIDGTVFISASTLSGYEFLPFSPNPYEQFTSIRPVAQISDGIFVYQGHFRISFIAALAHARRAEDLLEQNRINDALDEAQRSVSLAPDSFEAKSALARAKYRLQHQHQ